MKKRNYLSAILIVAFAGVLISSCSRNKREPGKIYIPDMAYSRAIETYAALDSTVFTADDTKRGQEIYYDRKPVDGTVKRGELFAYTLANDSAGYAQSATVKNPLPPLNPIDSAEASRLFNINCAICHGANGQASGPLSTSGKIGGVANFTLSKYLQMADGTMFHSVTYGIRNMGSYASQLDRKQRWMLIQYIRTLQPKVTAATATVAKAATDSASIVKAK